MSGSAVFSRKKGERAFYHYLDDEQVRVVADGTFGDDLALHSPLRAVPSKEILEHDVGSLLDDLEALECTRAVAAFEGLDHEVEARREVDLDRAEVGDGDRGASEGRRGIRGLTAVDIDP